MSDGALDLIMRSLITGDRDTAVRIQQYLEAEDSPVALRAGYLIDAADRHTRADQSAVETRG
jgi:hypothetical protein